jgi:hypothetical protein
LVFCFLVITESFEEPNETTLSHGSRQARVSAGESTLAKIDMECMARWSRWLQDGNGNYVVVQFDESTFVHNALSYATKLHTERR